MCKRWYLNQHLETLDSYDWLNAQILCKIQKQIRYSVFISEGMPGFPLAKYKGNYHWGLPSYYQTDTEGRAVVWLIKLLFVMPACHIRALLQVLAALFQVELPANTGKQWKMIQVFRHLQPMKETQIEFLAPGFGLAQHQLLQSIGKWVGR